LDEKVSSHTPGRGILAGDHTGRDAVFTWFGRYGLQWLGSRLGFRGVEGLGAHNCTLAACSGRRCRMAGELRR
jgi:hypothetical protein